MKIIILFFLLSIGIQSCGQEKLNNIKNQMTEKKYFINYDLFASYQIYVNDIKIINENGDGLVSGYVEINPFIRRGVNEIKLVSFLLNDSSKYNIPENLIDDIKLELWTSDSNEENIKKIKSFILPRTFSTNPFFIEFNDSFDADVPFEILESAKRLDEIDENILKTKVLEKYNELHSNLQNGDVDKLNQEIKNGIDSEFSRNMLPPDQQNISTRNIEAFFSEQKNKMLPIENYKLEFYGQNRLVSLVRIDKNPIFHGEDVLISKVKDDEGDYIYYINRVFLLIQDNQNNELEVWRYRNKIVW